MLWGACALRGCCGGLQGGGLLGDCWGEAVRIRVLSTLKGAVQALSGFAEEQVRCSRRLARGWLLKGKVQGSSGWMGGAACAAARWAWCMVQDCADRPRQCLHSHSHSHHQCLAANAGLASRDCGELFDGDATASRPFQSARFANLGA